MSLQTHVSGRADEFVGAARALRGLATALQDGSQTLTAATRVSRDEFDGDTAHAFTTTAAALAPGVRDLAEESRGFGAATLVYGERLEEVQQVMRRARRVARGHGLRVHAGTIDRPDAATSEQRQAYDRLRSIVTSAWAVLAGAEQDLQDAAQAADPLEPVERGRRRGAVTGIPPGVDPAARRPVTWPPREEDWPAEQPVAQDPAEGRDPGPAAPHPERSPAQAHDRSGHGSGGGRLEAAPALASALMAGLAVRPAATAPPGPRFDLAGTVPDDWTVRQRPRPGVILSARAPGAEGSDFPPRIVVRAETLSGPVAVWQAQQVAALGRELPGFELEDSAGYELGGRPVSWVQYSHDVVTPDGVVEVVDQQWAWRVDGLAVALTGSAAGDDIDDSARLFQQVAAVLGSQRPVSGDRPAS